MRIRYVPWHRSPDAGDRAPTREGQAESMYAELAHRIDAVAVRLPNQVAPPLGLPATRPPDAAALTGADTPRRAARAIRT
ncbi:hypothetical protein ACIBJF_31480 [Streptomyces sp. NPDC050743]|uniref:hypothetical protein n=1 Tax=Streptomyces sp. NPDC050743 TaxID=3365634 RepID=UPI0037B02B3C